MRLWSKKTKVCLVTITSPNFVPGTLVMLYSFLKYNDWFKGDILIYAYDLSDKDRAYLQRFPNVKFIEPFPEVVERVEAILKVRPGLAYKKMVFYSLNLFNLKGYDKYFYIDSDVFFQDSIEELVDMDHTLMCCKDSVSYKGFAKDGDTFEMVQDIDRGGNLWFRTFNAGIFFLDKALVNRKVYQSLLDLLDPKLYEGLGRPTTDQFLLNHFFRNDYHILPGIYNYRVNLAEHIKTQEGFSFEDVKIFHFPGQKNPWMADQVLRMVLKNKVYWRAFQLWNKLYMEMLEEWSEG
jgi:lipopolysaccharide biosynthesis glycosyltransferase